MDHESTIMIALKYDPVNKVNAIKNLFAFLPLACVSM